MKHSKEDSSELPLQAIGATDASPLKYEGAPSGAALADMFAAARDGLIRARAEDGPYGPSAVAHEGILRLLAQQLRGEHVQPLGAATPLDVAEQLADVFRFDVPPSHRPKLGPLVTRSKRLVMQGLKSFHVEILRPQAEFNRALVEVLRRVLSGTPADSGDWIRQRLAGLADASAWRVKSHRGGLAARVVELGKRSYLGTSGKLIVGALQEQRQWNENLIRLLEVWGRADVPPALAEQLLAHLDAGADPLATVARGPALRATAFVWQELLRRQVQFNRQVLSLLGRKSVAAPPPVDYPQWAARRETERLAALKAALIELTPRLSFSVVLTVGSETGDAFGATIETLAAQLYGRWDLRVIGDGLAPAARAAIERHVTSLGPRAALIEGGKARHELPLGDWVTFVHAGDRLAPHALAEVAVWLTENPAAELVYADEDRLGPGGRAEPFFKPGFSEAQVACCDYTSRPLFVRRSFFEAVGLSPDASPPALGHQLTLLAAERGAPVGHIAEVLYTLRSKGQAPRARDFVPALLRAPAVAAHFRRQGQAARVEAGPRGLKVHFVPERQPLVSIVVPFKDKPELLEQLLTSIRQTRYREYELLLVSNNSVEPETFALLDRADDPRVRKLVWDQPFRYPAINNFAAREARGELLLFLNNDIEITDPEWLTVLVGEALRPGVGAVAPKLLFPDGKIQHAGVVLGMGGFANHVFAGLPDDGTWTPFGTADWSREYLALTSACLMMRQEVFAKLEGFDERFQLCGSDVDLCLRARALGLKVIYTGATSLVHHESATRRADAIPPDDYWESFRAYRPWLGADPWYSPRLSLSTTVPALKAEGEAPAIETALCVLIAQGAPGNDSGLSGGRLAYARQSQGMAQMLDCTPEQVRREGLAKVPGKPPRHLTWFVPFFKHPFGGVHTILRFADAWRRRHGVTNHFVIYDNPNVTEREILARVAMIYSEPPGSFEILKGVSGIQRLPPTDVAMATLWTSAYFTLKHPSAQTRAYFVQDFEPTFYAAGTLSALAENTYRLGHFGIFNSPGLRDWITAHYPMDGVAFEPAVDRDVFHARGRRPASGPTQLFFYGRPSVDRNAFELGLEALRVVKKRLGNAVRIVSAGEGWNPAWFGAGDVLENLGILPYKRTAELYRTVDVGLCFMFTKHPSYLPLELMASGVTVVTNDNPANTWLLRDGENCLLAMPTVSAVAAQLEAAVRNRELRTRVGQAAAERMAASSWDAAADRAWEGLVAHCTGAIRPGTRRKAGREMVSGSLPAK